MKTMLLCRFIIILMFCGTVSLIFAQNKKTADVFPRIQASNCDLSVTLNPESHEFKATATIQFTALEQVQNIGFTVNENLYVQKVVNSEGVELEFDQNRAGREMLFIRFASPLPSGTSETIKIDYEGGFDKDRYSRMYSRDESSAYIGIEGTYLMYTAKWFPIGQYLVDRFPGKLEVTVPLGMSVIGPGQQSSVITKGINETFTWNASSSILPGTFVAGRYFSQKMQVGDFSIDCFSRDKSPDFMKPSAEIAGKILEYYRNVFGPSASGNQFRLVEVDDVLVRQHGMLGTIFITRRELAQSKPPVRELARRIAMQWWQETIGVSHSADLWLSDGMAYFSAARYFGHSGGASAFKEEMDNLAVLALKFENKSAVRVGLDLGYRTEKYESVVAGKGAWILNMLYSLIGEDKFNQLMPQYLRDYSKERGSTALFQKMAEKLYGKDLNWFFSEWLDTIGVPAFQLDYVLFKTPSGFRVSGTIKQEQDLFRMPIELSVAGSGREEFKTVEANGKSSSFDVAVLAKPQKVVLDPANRLLRDSKELRTAVQLSLGNDFKQAGSFVEAVHAYDEALKLSPHRSLVHFRLAEVFFEQFNLQSSANSFRDALNGDKDPKWIEVWCYIYLGKIYDILGQRQRAMAEYTKALNTKDDTDGAQAEAGKWLETPFTRERTIMNTDSKSSE
jgi:tetratricopeptide (TPR) repeat protein